MEPHKRTNDGKKDSAFEDLVKPCEWFTPLRKGRLRGVFLTFAMVNSVEFVELGELVELVELVESVKLVELGKNLANGFPQRFSFTLTFAMVDSVELVELVESV